jgi:hypothetical protein
MTRCGLLLFAALPLLASEPSLRRAAFTPLEQALDKRLMAATADDPFDLLGSTRGLYLPGYGAVFTSELSLVVTPTLNPFRQKITPEEAKRVHDRKLKRLPILKLTMREMLMAAAAALDPMPGNEQVVIAIRMLYLPWEDTTGLPSEIVMRADRAALLRRASADAAVRVEEY